MNTFIAGLVKPYIRVLSLILAILFCFEVFPQNVGIGTITPGGKLEIRHTSSLSDPTLLLYDNNLANYARLQLQNASGNKYWHLAGFIDNAADSNSRLNFFHSVNGDLLSIRGDGRIGIGTSNAAVKLHIRGGTTEKIRLEGSASSIGFYSIFDGSQQALLDYSGFGLRLATFPGTGWPIRFYTNGLEVVTFLSGGNVGIGNINPAYKLEVNGTANISNTLYLNGQAGTTGQILTSAGTGSVPTWENPPQAPQISFFAFLSANTSISSGTPTTITGYGELHDDGSNFNTVTGQFTAPENGVYHFDAKMQLQSPPSGNTPLTIRIKKNGAVFEGCQSDIILQAVTGYSFSIAHGLTIKLLAGDVVSVELTQNATGSLSLNGGGSSASCFSGFRLY
ncbi:MAG: hypothetical protein JNK14_19810 [Chitinophagaceae bacterium]|nr:hypothetical protein [Chitinophagaceae bacterium]